MSIFLIVMTTIHGNAFVYSENELDIPYGYYYGGEPEKAFLLLDHILEESAKTKDVASIIQAAFIDANLLYHAERYTESRDLYKELKENFFKDEFTDHNKLLIFDYELTKSLMIDHDWKPALAALQANIDYCKKQSKPEIHCKASSILNGFILNSNTSYNQATTELLRYINTYPNDDYIYMELGYSYAKLKKQQQAKECYAHVQKPEQLDYVDRLGLPETAFLQTESAKRIIAASQYIRFKPSTLDRAREYLAMQQIEGIDIGSINKIKEIQTILQHAGYAIQTINGLMNQETLNELERFAQDHKTSFQKKTADQIITQLYHWSLDKSPNVLDSFDINRLSQSVCTIFSVSPRPEVFGMGNGFLLDQQTVLTHSNVIEDAKSINVYFNEDVVFYDVRVLNKYPLGGLVTLSLPEAVTSIDSLQLSDTPAMIGDDIVLIGSVAGNISKSVSKGHISSNNTPFSTRKLHLFSSVDFNTAGCPIFNTNGEVVGMYDSLEKSGHNIHLAISAESIRSFIEK